MSQIYHSARGNTKIFVRTNSPHIFSYILSNPCLNKAVPNITTYGYVSGSSGNTSKCYGELGCLEINEDWYGLTRPINLLPQDRDVINCQFILRTREMINEVGLIVLEKNSNARLLLYQ